MPNRLRDATSPYLLQHQDNPVDWYEWGPDAFAAARLRDVPILLSVGYSACHWCHVMAHESFEDLQTAMLMNAQFVNVKVDREERPDVDRVYMDAVQAATGRGGWPMTVFLTPDGRPFFAGTYFPKTSGHGMPAFTEVLAAVTDAWSLRRSELTAQADRLTSAVRVGPTSDPDLLDREELRHAFDTLASLHDREAGGFGGAPKFPQAPTLEFIMRTAALDPTRRDSAVSMLRVTLGHMARGGIYDQLGGGFSRYSVDRSWLVPHFEKMLYDNALLARVYLRSWQLTGDDDFRRVAVETLDYLLRDMIDPSGGIHAAEDADSEGVEGKFYVWTWDQLGEVLGSDREIAAQLYGVTEEGNFEGANILHLPASLAEIAATTDVSKSELIAHKRSIDERLLSRRGQRVRPGRDDKIVTAWNGMALRALAEASTVLGSNTYRGAAERLGAYLIDDATADGGLVRSRRLGRGDINGFCDDYAAAATGFFALYQATGDTSWFTQAELLTRQIVDKFADPAGGFFATAADAEALIARPKNLMDNPTPSDNSLAAEALLTLAAYTGESDLNDLVEGVVRAAAVVTRRNPAFGGHLLAVWLTAVHGIDEVAVVAPQPVSGEFTSVVWERFRPNAVLAVSSGDADGTSATVPLLEGRDPGTDGLAYVCRNFVCSLPAASAAQLRDQLAGTSGETA